MCKVLKTRCPLSARLRTVSAVSVSRISPTKMISGSSLITAFSAFLNDQVSCPTCLCEILHLSPSKIYSIGSSMVMMFSFLVLLIYSIILTSEVDFPLPVDPVTRKSPFFAARTFLFILSARLENIISSSVLMRELIFLITIQIFPFSKKAFTL